MYLDFFGLSKYPFSTAADPRFYYPTGKHREALACLMYTVQQRKGFALITGEVGAGKTMLCRAALARFGEMVEVALVSHTLFGPKQFMEAICSEYGMETSDKTKFDLVNGLKRFLLERWQEGVPVALIVDEAQDLAHQVLEELRLLGNMETGSEKLLQIILVGQPELRRIIATAELRQLEQRLALKFHLSPLSAREVSGYIRHRLHVAGGKNEVFDAAARDQVHKASHGIPRLVNILCDQALLQAYVNDEPKVTAEVIRRVVADREGYYMEDDEESGNAPPIPSSPPAPKHQAKETDRARCIRCGAPLEGSGAEGNGQMCPACAGQENDSEASMAAHRNGKEGR